MVKLALIQGLSSSPHVLAVGEKLAPFSCPVLSPVELYRVSLQNYVNLDV